MLEIASQQNIVASQDDMCARFAAALMEQPIEELSRVAAEIEYYESTGILKGSALALIKSVEGAKKRTRHQRPQLLAS